MVIVPPVVAVTVAVSISRLSALIVLVTVPVAVIVTDFRAPREASNWGMLFEVVQSVVVTGKVALCVTVCVGWPAELSYWNL